MEQKPSIGRVNTEKSVLRFWSKVSVPENHRGACWIWTASLDARGYGQFRIDGKTRKAHQISFEALHGEAVPYGKELDHLCRNRNCINPWHLEPVTHRENCRRGKRWSGATCMRGHAWTEENTIYRNDGRECRICRNANKRSWWHKQKRKL